MSQETELKRLEGFVSKLLQSFRELKDENARLEQELQDSEQTVANLKEQLAVNDMERTEINDRVTGIIDQIEEWEIELGEEVVTSDVPINDPSRQGNLFSSVAADEADEAAGEPQQESMQFSQN